MRFDDIAAIKHSLSHSSKPLPTAKLGQSNHLLYPMILHESVKRRLGRLISLFVLNKQQSFILRTIGCQISFLYDLLCLGERFSTDVSKKKLLEILPSEKSARFLVIGCNNGHDEDVQFWLRNGAKHLNGIDLYSFEEDWSVVAPALSRHFQAEVRFGQAPIESLPFPNEYFDVLASSAVLEHIHDPPKAVDETARVLRRGGLAWHGFGPLYYSFSGDHCISSYGLDHAYDHLLLSDADYRTRINNQSFYDTQIDPHNNFWAKTDQFSFFKAKEYISLFSRHFEIKHLLVKISREALSYRRLYKQNWDMLLSVGVSEEDLLISGLNVILRKK